ncbi:sialidase family protein [Allonocardiopsis opalescens]|uniref:Putative neuraminidase n=1 Tax=Allonocardiopsis opalescens TaxID=1144618 RepID=A0A2T0Q7D5_9ACTN|nr:exo-alpha-sialidase [Allonocardiopsis opalescens]PRX99701.1 putative neuraminidase [Allonocardiopsis opalescens]
MSGGAPAPALPTDGRLRPVPGDPGRRDAFLPAPTVQAHAANLAVLPGGDLGCVWFGGTQEGVADISVWFSRLAPGGEGWSEPVRLSDDGTRSEQNPLLFAAPDGTLRLLYTAQHAGDQDTAEVRERVSGDGGQSWGPVRTLVPASGSGGVFVRQPVVVLAPERWLLPVFHCVRPPAGRWVGDLDTSGVLVSDDQGASWTHHPVPGSTGCVHMNIVPLDDGTLLALFRSRRADAVHAARSDDGGRSWTRPEPTELPNNNSSIQAVRLRDGRVALVYNASSRADATERRVSLYDEIDGDGLAAASAPAPAGGPPAAGAAFWGAPRAPLTLAISADGGRSWPLRRNLETGNGYCMTNNSRDGLNRELSYPSVVQTSDGLLQIAFTYHRRAIKHVQVSPEWAAADPSERRPPA